MSTHKEGDREVFHAFLHDYPDEDGWLDTDDEPPYSTAEILRVADWLVQEGYAEPQYAETLRRVMERGKEGACHESLQKPN
jgi:hypothetical protein